MKGGIVAYIILVVVMLVLFPLFIMGEFSTSMNRSDFSNLIQKKWNIQIYCAEYPKDVKAKRFLDRITIIIEEEHRKYNIKKIEEVRELIHGSIHED